jgi:hypothetical protein
MSRSMDKADDTLIEMAADMEVRTALYICQGMTEAAAVLARYAPRLELARQQPEAGEIMSPAQQSLERLTVQAFSRFINAIGNAVSHTATDRHAEFGGEGFLAKDDGREAAIAGLRAILEMERELLQLATSRARQIKDEED